MPPFMNEGADIEEEERKKVCEQTGHALAAHLAKRIIVSQKALRYALDMLTSAHASGWFKALFGREMNDGVLGVAGVVSALIALSHMLMSKKKKKKKKK